MKKKPDFWLWTKNIVLTFLSFIAKKEKREMDIIEAVLNGEIDIDTAITEKDVSLLDALKYKLMPPEEMIKEGYADQQSVNLLLLSISRENKKGG